MEQATMDYSTGKEEGRKIACTDCVGLAMSSTTTHYQRITCARSPLPPFFYHGRRYSLDSVTGMNQKSVSSALSALPNRYAPHVQRGNGDNPLCFGAVRCAHSLSAVYFHRSSSGVILPCPTRSAPFPRRHPLLYAFLPAWRAAPVSGIILSGSAVKKEPIVALRTE